MADELNAVLKADYAKDKRHLVFKVTLLTEETPSSPRGSGSVPTMIHDTWMAMHERLLSKIVEKAREEDEI